MLNYDSGPSSIDFQPQFWKVELVILASIVPYWEASSLGNTSFSAKLISIKNRSLYYSSHPLEVYLIIPSQTKNKAYIKLKQFINIIGVLSMDAVSIGCIAINTKWSTLSDYQTLYSVLILCKVFLILCIECFQN